MNHFSRLLTAASICLMAAIPFTNSASAGVLRVEIGGFVEITGKVMIAVFDDAEHFLSKSGGAVKKLRAKVTGAEMSVTIADLPPGQYGISIYHDENGNGELDTNFLGIPKEPYGFSNNARGFAGPRKFDATLITVTEQETTISIDLE